MEMKNTVFTYLIKEMMYSRSNLEIDLRKCGDLNELHILIGKIQGLSKAIDILCGLSDSQLETLISDPNIKITSKWNN